MVDEILPNLYLGRIDEIKKWKTENKEGMTIDVWDYPVYGADYWCPIIKLENFDRPIKSVSQVYVTYINSIGLKVSKNFINHAINIVIELLNQNKKVMIACAESVERSPLTTAFVVAKIKNITFKDAYNFVALKHPRTIKKYDWLSNDILHGIFQPE